MTTKLQFHMSLEKAMNELTKIVDGELVERMAKLSAAADLSKMIGGGELSKYLGGEVEALNGLMSQVRDLAHQCKNSYSGWTALESSRPIGRRVDVTLPEHVRPSFIADKSYDRGNPSGLTPLRPLTSQSVDLNEELLATTLRHRIEEHQ